MQRARRRSSSAGAELEVALADHVSLLEIDQERAPFADHPVEREEIPDVNGPPDVAALARRRPLGRLQIAQRGGADPRLRLERAEWLRPARDLYRAPVSYT